MKKDDLPYPPQHKALRQLPWGFSSQGPNIEGHLSGTQKDFLAFTVEVVFCPWSEGLLIGVGPQHTRCWIVFLMQSGSLLPFCLESQSKGANLALWCCKINSEKAQCLDKLYKEYYILYLTYALSFTFISGGYRSILDHHAGYVHDVPGSQPDPAQDGHHEVHRLVAPLLRHHAFLGLHD